MADNSKDTIYVDIDDEITTLIDKVRASNSRLVALVLPKRASVLQSIVNMKLLKRTADSEKKNIVLITTESGLLPLAGAVGLHTAANLTSKPEIPKSPMLSTAGQETVDEDMDLHLDDEDAPDLAQKAGLAASVGDLAASVEKPVNPLKAVDNLETVDMTDAELASSDEEEQPPEDVKPKKDKHLKVPNFDRFRTLFIFGVLLILALGILGYFVLAVWPHATIEIKTDASNVNTNISLTLDTGAQSANISSADIPATQVSQQKTYTQTVNTTGQKNEGTAATGSVTMSANDCNGTYSSNPNTFFNFTVPAGTAVTVNNLTYITQADTQLDLTGPPSNNCYQYKATSSTVITAQGGGSNYNTGNNTTFSVPSYPEVTAVGSASGGTDNIIQIVAQADVNTATSKINTNANSVKQSLINQLKGQGLYPIDVTFTSGTPQVSANPSVGSPSNTVTVTETITYTMFGASKSNLNALLDANIKSQTSKNQNIISNGLSQSSFRQVSANGSTDQVSLNTFAEVGPNISVASIKKESAGQSPKAIISKIRSNPDVTGVIVKLNPFYVTTAPTNQSKITVNIAKPTKTA